MTKRAGLGKGLGAIFGEDVMDSAQADQLKEEKGGYETGREKTVKAGSKEEEETGKGITLKLPQIEPNTGQPGKDFNPEMIQELTDSVRQYEVLQPPLVQRKGDHYEITAGERRWRAAEEAGLKEIPVAIREYTKQQTMEIALIENVQREDLDPIKEARAYQQLTQELDLAQEEIAVRVSKNRATIANSMRLLKLDKRVQEMLTQGMTSSEHARALLALEDGEQRYQMTLKIASERLSVRDIERLVKQLSEPKKIKKMEEEGRNLSFIFKDLEERVKQIMSTEVNINKKDRDKGRIEIKYYSKTEPERLMELIESMR